MKKNSTTAKKEKVITPLELAERIIPNLRVCIASFHLYPEGSGVVQKLIDTTYAALSEILEKNETVTIVEKEGDLLFNDSPIMIDRLKGLNKHIFENFTSILRQTRLKSLTFKAGLSPEELKSFLSTFSQKHWRKEDDLKILTDSLKKQQVYHIAVNEWSYEAVGESSIVTDKPKKTVTSLGELTRALEEVSEIFAISEDAAVRNNAKLAIVDKLTKLSPNLLARFFDEKLSDNIERIKEEIIIGLPADYIKEIVIKIAKLYQELKKSIPPGSDQEYELVQLRSAINKLLSFLQGKAVCIEICNELLRMDFPELVPPWWQKPELSEMELIVSQAALLSEKDSLALLEDDSQTRLPQIFLELDRMSRRDLIEKLMGKLNENISASTAGIRFRTVSLVKKLVPTLESLANKDLTERTYDKILEQMDKETDFTIYNEYSGIIITHTNSVMKSYNYEKINQIVGMLRKHRHDKTGGFHQRPEYADKTLNVLGNTDMMNFLIEAVKSRNIEKQKEATKIILQLENSAAVPLIDTIKSIEDFGLRKFIVEIIKNIGKDAVIRLLQRLDMTVETAELIKIMQILPGLGYDDTAAEQLEKIIHHPEKRIRLEAVRTLGRLDSAKVGEELVSILFDEEDFIRREVINLLGDIRYGPAVPALSNLIKPKLIFQREPASEMIQEAACRALGSIGGTDSQRVLLEVVKEKYFFRPKTRATKIAAIYALKRFKTKRVGKTLLVLQNNKDRFVRTAAKNILKNM